LGKLISDHKLLYEICSDFQDPLHLSIDSIGEKLIFALRLNRMEIGI